MAARRAHNPEAVGSSPTPAKERCLDSRIDFNATRGVALQYLERALSALKQWFFSGVPLFLSKFYVSRLDLVIFSANTLPSSNPFQKSSIYIGQSG